MLLEDPMKARPVLRQLLDGRVTNTPTQPKALGPTATYASRMDLRGLASPPGFDPFTVAGRVEAGLLMGTS